MKTRLKQFAIKYLIAASALMPVANTVNAKTQVKNRKLPSSLYATCGTQALYFSISAGPTFMLPMPNIDKDLGKQQTIGFNGGGFIEIGGACWRRIEFSDAEILLEPGLRFEVLSMNTCAYGINKARMIDVNTNVAACPYEAVQSFATTANFNLGIGYKGFDVETAWGLGYRVDTKQQHAALLSVGCGFSGRINDQIKLKALYRLNTDIVTGNKINMSSRQSHGIELGLTYVFSKRRQNQCWKYAKNQFHR